MKRETRSRIIASAKLYAEVFHGRIHIGRSEADIVLDLIEDRPAGIPADEKVLFARTAARHIKRHHAKHIREIMIPFNL